MSLRLSCVYISQSSSKKLPRSADLIFFLGLFKALQPSTSLLQLLLDVKPIQPWSLISWWCPDDNVMCDISETSHGKSSSKSWRLRKVLTLARRPSRTSLEPASNARRILSHRHLMTIHNDLVHIVLLSWMSLNAIMLLIYFAYLDLRFLPSGCQSRHQNNSGLRGQEKWG